MSGRVLDNTLHPITHFIEELQNVKQISRVSSGFTTEKLFDGYEVSCGRYASKKNVTRVNVDETTQWRNHNSGNTVKWFPVNVEFEEVGRRNVSKQEKAYAKYGSKYSIIRNLWNNG